MIILCEKRKAILASTNHLLIEGGPGSGKTTIALLKSQSEINEGGLLPSQKVLFLSFARATVSKIQEETHNIFDREETSQLEINTYHGFIWNLLKSFGKLIIPQKSLQIITPPEAAIHVPKMGKEARREKFHSLLQTKGIIAFDLFAETMVKLLGSTNRLREMISDLYPIIVVDEFQDTDSYEWKLVKLLGMNSRIIALADQDQRIYDFRGADPKRIGEFIEHFEPDTFDFEGENNRSSSTDIVQFGNDVLVGKNKGREYNDVKILEYKYHLKEFTIKAQVLQSISRLNSIKPDKNWSLAILTGTKKGTLELSSILAKRVSNLPEMSHDILVDASGPSLSAILIANLMEPIEYSRLLSQFIQDVIAHIHGKNPDKTSKKDLETADFLNDYLRSGAVRGSKRQLLIDEIKEVINKRMELQFSGNPQDDWLLVRNLLDECQHENLGMIHFDSIFIKLLRKGTILREKLSERWRMQGSYLGARAVVKDALLQEHFSLSKRKWEGILVMTTHKSKGKEFDEVIIWEDQFTARIVQNADDIDKSRNTLRVAATRARSRVTILTPTLRRCELL